MLLWLRLPFFAFQLGGLLLIFFLKFIGFQVGEKSLFIGNFLLFITVIGLGFYYIFYPPQSKFSSLILEHPEINYQVIREEALIIQSLTQAQIKQKLIGLEKNLEQQLPSPISQKTYLDLVVLSYQVGENEKASQYLNQARFSNPNSNYFK